MQKYIQSKVGAFGGRMLVDPATGCMYRDNSNLPESKAKVVGKTEAINGVSTNVPIKPVVQGSCDANGRLLR